MEITYKGNTVKFEDPLARVTVLLHGKEYRTQWGRRPEEPGNLPTFPYIAENLLNAGLFEGFKHQYVPILADSYSTQDSRKYMFPDTIQSNHCIEGILVKLVDEKRVYVVGTVFRDHAGHSFRPKQVRLSN